MLVALFTLITFGVYARGVQSIWHSAGVGRGIRRFEPPLFGSGLVVLALALELPLDNSFSAHMIQHLLLIAVAAPLMAMGNPSVAFAWALRLRLPPPHLMPALAAFALHSITLWLWHVPALYEAALNNEPVHVSEHMLLFGTAFIFWSTALQAGGGGILYVFALSAQCTGLGALITLSSRPWYSSYSVMDDQVVAGALMWVPAGFVYLAYALALLGRWLRVRPARSSQAHLRQRPLPGAPAPR